MTITKRVRMTPEDADRLARLAADSGKSESEILREGIRAYVAADKKRRAIDELMKMAEEDDISSWVKAGGFR